ncbi:hypothetical protein LJX77_26110 [Vibrio coralliilyticus]|nr:hypothetical protein [Vibrio coralliilyticus]
MVISSLGNTRKCCTGWKNCVTGKKNITPLQSPPIAPHCLKSILERASRINN